MAIRIRRIACIGGLLLASIGIVTACDDNAHGSAALAAAVGCADGQREGFQDSVQWPNIAGCSGAWTIPGLHTHDPGIAPACPGLSTFDTTVPACGRAAGDDGANPAGTGCNVADLCAPGWHVCTSSEDVASRSSTGCQGATQANDPPLFFATRQSTNGCGVCANGSLTGPSCDSATCAAGCLQTASTSNDFYGCGNFGSTLTCEPLDRFVDNLCSALAGSTWSCDLPTAADDNGLCEAYTALKSGPSYGGVLCCRDVLCDDSDGDGYCDDKDPCPLDPVNDADGDGVCGDADLCPGTALPEDVPTDHLGVNRFADTDGDRVFETVSPNGQGPGRSYTIQDTAGCSCEQIIAALGLGIGHTKFGCSISAMDDWLAQVNGG